MLTFYISGHISHDPDYKIKFDLAEKVIADQARLFFDEGFYIVNPASNQPTKEEFEQMGELELWAKYMIRDMESIAHSIRSNSLGLKSEIIIVQLPGWEESRGAVFEKAYAEHIAPTQVKIRSIYDFCHDWDKLVEQKIKEAHKGTDHLAEVKDLMDPTPVIHSIHSKRDLSIVREYAFNALKKEREQ